MQRPARIMVFGVLCLLVGALSGINNLVELGIAAMGPEAVPTNQAGGGGGSFTQMLSEQNEAVRQALGQPVYRVVFGLDALAGMVMAVVLVTSGVGLFMDKLAAIKLAKAWAYFAIVSAVITVVLNARFLMPNMSSALPGSSLMMGVCMLPMLWLFPILLLTVLCRREIVAYLEWREGQASQPAAAFDHVTQAPPRDERSGNEQSDDEPATTPRDSDPMPTVAPRPGNASQADQTWRDDPWNDPNT